MNNQLAQCFHCQRNSDEIPLFEFQFNGAAFWICPQHLPLLIHKPEQIAQKLPGAKFGDDALDPQY
jgi:hypothetical protein